MIVIFAAVLISREHIPVKMEIMSEYIFLYDPLLNCLWQGHVVRQADESTTVKTSCNNLPVTPNYQNLFAIDYCFWIEYHLT